VLAFDRPDAFVTGSSKPLICNMGEDILLERLNDAVDGLVRLPADRQQRAVEGRLEDPIAAERLLVPIDICGARVRSSARSPLGTRSPATTTAASA
jgi:hypothetical protein